MADEFLGRGWKFPVQVGPDGAIALSAHEDDVREAVRLVLLTARGERAMRPDFGAGLHDHVFERMTATNAGALQASIRTALLTWEPRIELLGVEVSPDVGGGGEIGRLRVGVEYRVRATNTRFNLVFPFYLEEGR